MQTKEEFVKFLGKGAYGSVDLVKYTNIDGSSFDAAVKTSDIDDYDSLQKELQILCELRGFPGIVECYRDNLEERLSNGYRVYKLLLEYASEGSLNAFMDNYTDRKLPDPMIRDFTRMILEGLVAIHGHGYVHCDLKSDNLLVFPCGDSSYELKISDFGNSLEVGEVPHYWEIDFPYVGTPVYMPPESFCDGVANKTLDLWSLGCLVLEMYTGEMPWPGVEVDDLVVLLRDGDDNAPEIPENVPCDAREFIEMCFSRNPDERGTASDLLLHRFLIREEKKPESIIPVVTVEEETNSLLLRLKSKIRRRASNKSRDVTEKKPQFKKILKKLLRLKRIISLKPLDSSLVFVH